MLLPSSRHAMKAGPAVGRGLGLDGGRHGVAFPAGVGRGPRGAPGYRRRRRRSSRAMTRAAAIATARAAHHSVVARLLVVLLTSESLVRAVGKVAPFGKMLEEEGSNAGALRGVAVGAGELVAAGGTAAAGVGSGDVAGLRVAVGVGVGVGVGVPLRSLCSVPNDVPTA